MMNSILIAPIFLPLLAGLISLLLPKRWKFLPALLSIIVAGSSLGVASHILTLKDPQWALTWLFFSPDLRIGFDLYADHFGRIGLIIAFAFTLLISIYSLRLMADHPRQREYYAYLMMTSAAASGVLLADNLIVVLFFWELVGILLYALVSIGGMRAMPAANKTLIIIGLADLSLLLGIALLWSHSGTLSVSDLMANPQALSGWVPTTAFILMMLGALAKAGAIPLHSWIPAISTEAPLPVMAYLPAALDKLLGIYLLARISISLFMMTPAMGIVLMAIGAITIVGAVLMALIQHDYRKMLGFSAVSQVGYMVLGIGTGTPIGIIGGLFHMLNNMIYKSCLFLCGASVQNQTKKTEFAELGGLAGAMPWTFSACLIAALAMSGVPPLNGFVSKWLIYQGILDQGSSLFPLFLLAAMFGSAFTLAYSMKLLYSLFWGDRPKELGQVKEVGWPMRVPVALLALACLSFGIFYLWPVNQLFKPILGTAGIQAIIPGIWQSTLASVLLIISLIIGFLFFLAGRPRQAVETEVFLGGEALDPEVYRVPGTQFYGPIKSLAGLQQLLSRGERGDFDLYTWLLKAIPWAAKAISRLIDQALSDLYRELIPALLRILGQVLQTLNGKQVLTYMLWIAYAGSAIAILRFPGEESAILIGRIIACIGIFGWAIQALIVNDLRRFVSYAATSQLGFVLLGSTASWQSAGIHFLSAGLAILALTICSRAIYRKRKTYDMQEMDGLAGQMPGRFTIFLLAGLWLSGLPPFGSFFSKYLLGSSFSSDELIFPILLAAAALLTLGYSLRPLRHFLRVGE